MGANNKKIAKNTVFLYIRLLVVMLISLYTVRVIMHELGVEGFGVFNVVAGFVSMLGFIGTTMTTGIQRFYNYEIGKNGESSAIGIYSAALKIQITCAVIALLGFETIGLWYVNNIMVLPKTHITEINVLYQFAIGTLLLNIIVIPYSAFAISKEHMDFYAILSMFEAIGKLVIAYSLSYFSNKLSVYGSFLFLLAVINFIGYYIFCKKKYPWLSYDKGSSKNKVKNIITFSGWNALSAFANIGKSQGVNLLLNYFFGVVINAANAVVTQVYSAVQLFSINICTAFRPQLTEAYARGDYNRTKMMFYIMSKLAYVMVFMICLPIYLELDYILHLWLGNEIPMFTKEFIGLTLSTVIVGSLNTPISQVIFANGNIRNYILVYSSIFLCVPFGWCFFKAGAPAISVFWITLILMIIIQIISMFLLKKCFSYKINEYLRLVLSPLLLFSIIVPILPIYIKISIQDSSFIRLVLVSGSSVIISVIVSYYLLLTKLQQKMVVEKLQNIIRRI